MEKIASFIEVFKRDSKKQILIRAKILEITLVDGSQFGIDINAILKGIDLFGSSANPGTIVQNFAAGKLATTAFKNFADPVSGSSHHTNLDLFMEALETHGEVTVLSSPEVSTLNGQKAIIRSVREDVVFQSSQSGTGGASAISSTTAEPFTYGVFLDVTPHVDSEGMITMDIHPSVSSFVELATSGRASSSSTTIDEGDDSVSTSSTSGASAASKPIIDTRETETVATVMDGETVIIAGLMQNFVKENISKFPILGDIPYLGKLFRREISEEVKTELVILITPTIVGPRAKNFGNHRADYRMLGDLFRK
jgi:MSHA biogenesis protein MshL